MTLHGVLICFLLIPPAYLLAFLIWVGLVYVNVLIDVLTWDHRKSQPRKWI